MIQATLATRTLPANTRSNKRPHCGLFQPANDGGPFREIILCEGSLLRRFIPTSEVRKTLASVSIWSRFKVMEILLATFDLRIDQQGRCQRPRCDEGHVRLKKKRLAKAINAEARA